MKSSLKFSIILFVVVVVIAALMQAGQKKPIDWRKTFNPEQKIPYGTYVFRQELKNMLHSNSAIAEANVSLYQYLENSKNTTNKAILFVGNNFKLGDVGRKKLFQFVKNGGTFFASATNFDNIFNDSLCLKTQMFNTFQTGMGYKYYPTSISLYKTKEKFIYDKLEWSKFFSILPSDSVTILGNIEKANNIAPNFIKLNYGRGTFFIHLAPEVFTNYYLLKDTTFSIATHTVQYLKGKNIIWYDGLHNIGNDQTPLRFILRQPALQAAWYILLLILLLYLIFQSRRKQGAIPVIVPEANRSVDFVKTIASMYYENGNPRNMAQKKLSYFLYDLRKTYHIDTEKLLENKFIKTLHQLTAIPERELIEFFTELEQLKEHKQYSISELKKINSLIETFKEKAKMKQ